ncbi:unnamed protein product [Miscanthus lutarioriparius]|uniref:Serpin domain-containing protein n=1 Tax=Miscanthus lutarioriparius TaxID=422564 RepID=A0A811SM32_9POAL|nr:unnamed protein product [Miscanthus lutarioriparius]
MASYLASQPTQHISQQPSPPRWHNHTYTPPQQWPPHRAAPAAPWQWASSTFAPPPPTLPSPWTARPNVTVVVPSGETPTDAWPGGGGGGSASLDELRHAAVTRLVAALRGIPQTSFACGVWVDRRCALREEFADVAGAVYAAVAESVDFVSQEARQRINDFVKDATKGLIGAVLPPGSVGSSTVAVLANALYFKGTWAQPFDPSRTFDAPFHLPDGTTVRAPFMTTTSRYEQQQYVAVFPGFRALKLPYSCKSGDQWHQTAYFYMLLLLPDDDHGLGDVYKAVSAPGFIRKHTPVGKVPVGRLMVPKFKFTFEFEASEMQKLGVSRAFAGGDFSSMFAGEGGCWNPIC